LVLAIVFSSSFSAIGEVVSVIAGIASDVETTVQAALDLLRKGDVSSARKRLSRIENVPDLPHPEIILADMMIAIGRPADAQSVLDPLSLGQEGTFDLHLAFAKLAIAQQRWFDAWTHVRLADKAERPSTWSSEHKEKMEVVLAQTQATICEGRGDWKRLKSIGEPFAKRSPPDAKLMALLGHAEFSLGNVDRAIKYLEKVRELVPGLDPPMLVIAQWHDSKSDSEQTEAAFRSAIAQYQDADLDESKLRLARWLLWNNRPDEAEPLLSGVPAGDDKRADQRAFLRASSARMRGDLAAAKSILTPLHQKEPTAFPVSNLLALIAIESSEEVDRSLAFELAKTNCNNQPNVAEAWSTLGWVLYKRGDLKSAHESLMRSAQAGQISRDTAYFIATVKSRMGQTAAAAELGNAAVSANGPFHYGQSKSNSKSSPIPPAPSAAP